MIRWLIALGLALLASPIRAEQCRLALALAMDISVSVDDTEDALQRQGLAAALLAPEVQEAFFSSPLPVAMSVYEWSGRSTQHVILNWRLIETQDDLRAAATRISQSTRSNEGSATAMGHALRFGAELLQSAPDCLFQTIDLSGDGSNNDGYGPQIAYARYFFGEIVVNGLVINAADFEGELFLIPFFKNNVLHGPGAFLEVAQGFEDFERTMRKKLKRELSGLQVGTLQHNAHD
ncbi:DUF1194 domain-containing protein [uncultured Ruegeria sp.]|uniref:DUF1194 domain-containing protein n=1 Tax=uncultured Ruegeria sp. TaxID=259304 RepID=UPI002613FEEB|nr:DUF1194 domain-containing protein [uncultured Ruegeria sp.]